MLVVVVILVAGLLKSHAEILRKLHDLGLGETDITPSETSATELRVAAGIAEPRLDPNPAADITGMKADGSAAVVGIVGADHPTLLAFLSTSCSSCHRFWEAFADPNLKLPHPDLRLVIVTKGPEAESESEVRRLGPPGVATVMSSDAYEAYGVPVSPFFVMVDGPTGRTIGEGASATWGQLQSLLRQAVADATSASKRSGRPASNRAKGRERSRDADEVLIAAGIEPGDPALFGRPDK